MIRYANYIRVPAAMGAVTRADAAALLRSAIGRGSRRLRQHAGDELTPSQSAVIATIALHGALTPSGIAEYERISRPTVTRIIRTLRARNLLTHHDDATDGRSYFLSVTSDGAALRELQRGRKNAYLRRLLRRATDEEVQLLAAAAIVLLELLDEVEP